MENLSEQTDAEKAGNAVKQTVKTNIGQIAEIGENAENAEETAQATERAEFGLDGLVADVNIPRERSCSPPRRSATPETRPPA